MNKSPKTHQKEKGRKTADQPKQTTLDNPLYTQEIESPKETNSEKKKHIEITKIETATKEEELALKIQVKLLPSKTEFSKITSELHFDGQTNKTHLHKHTSKPTCYKRF